MSIDTPAVTAADIAPAAAAGEPARSAWAETAIAVTFTVTAVLFVSFVAVMTGLV